MKINKLTNVMALALLAMTSCNKELFDKEVWSEMVEYQFVIDNADPYHDWCLTRNDILSVKSLDSKINKVQLLTANPYTSSSAEIVAETILYGSTESMEYTIPIIMNDVYLVAYDKDGNDLGYKTINYGTMSMELSTSDLQKPGTIKTPTYQTFTYLYVSTFPLPSEHFDFNDMVLRISKKNPDIANTLVVDLTVKLDACGTKESYAAAIQLADIRYDDIEKVEVLNDNPMDKGFPSEQRSFIESEDVLQKGRNGEAVISLFENAHWALKKEFDELGDIPTLYYNTSHTVVEESSEIVNPVTATYRITFKERDKALSLTFDRIDPFIMHKGSNGGTWEIHTYPHKFEGTLWETNAAAYNNHVSWALVIPKGDFRYPVEGISLSSYNSVLQETFGPYENFAAWMKDHNSNQDWYQQVTRPTLVY